MRDVKALVALLGVVGCSGSQLVDTSAVAIPGTCILASWPRRLESDGTLAKQAGVGGSCIGSKTPLRVFAAVYRPI